MYLYIKNVFDSPEKPKVVRIFLQSPNREFINTITINWNSIELFLTTGMERN